MADGRRASRQSQVASLQSESPVLSQGRQSSVRVASPQSESPVLSQGRQSSVMGEKDHSDKKLAGDGALAFVPFASIQDARAATTDPIARAQLLADVCRLNTLYMIMAAGSGHVGSSFSST